jgi:hypothetical protein
MEAIEERAREWQEMIVATVRVRGNWLHTSKEE